MIGSRPAPLIGQARSPAEFITRPEKRMPMRALKTCEIIHLFALLHAAVAFLCRTGGVDDELALTLLSILMILLICLRRGLNVEFTAACIIVVNVIGYLLGTGIAALIGRAMASQPLVHALSSCLTTEVLGWGVVGTVKFFGRGERTGAPRRTPRIGLLLLAVGAIFALRLAYVEFLRSSFCPLERIYAMRDALWSSSPALIFLLGANVIFVRSMRRGEWSSAVRTVLLSLFLAVSALGGALIAGLQLTLGEGFAPQDAWPLLLVALVSEATLYSAVFIVDYALTARDGLRAERGRTHRAQFLYMKLKQQVNPHFLINSLNILDCLVCEERTAQASDFIHKLAGVYRYMLQNEQEQLVRLENELAFVGKYVELLQVRFADGFRVEFDIASEARTRNIVPCSMQLLVENAIKHNVVDAAEQLVIRIAAAGDRVSVSNNLRPRLSVAPSTHVGLEYIRQQYLDLAGAEIEIDHTAESYRVTLPLL